MKSKTNFSSIIPKGDKEVLEQAKEESSEVVDDVNSKIMEFVGAIFEGWVEDYKVRMAKIRDWEFSHHLEYANQGVEKNVQQKCIPIDYFAQRLLQSGLVSSSENLRLVVESMLSVDNQGFTVPS